MKIVGMKKTLFQIPEDIKELVMNENVLKLTTIKAAYEKFDTNTEDYYISKYTTMLHMEEAEDMKRLAKYEIENAELSLKSWTDKLFFIKNNRNKQDEVRQF